MQLRPAQVYHRKIRQNDLQPDPAQEKALAALERLYDALALAAGRVNGRTPLQALAALSRLLPFARSVPQEAPHARGVWLWGGSGAANRC